MEKTAGQLPPFRVFRFHWRVSSAILPVMSQTLYLCMGSACHQRRGYALLPMLEALIRRHGLNDRLLLRGAFCLENCQRGCSLKFDGRIFTDLNEQNLQETFEREILPRCQPL